jgi:hypothetical protein
MFEDINFDELWLDEDLFQVGYNHKNYYIIDVGWYPAFSQDGSFRIVIVENGNWNDFLYEKRTRDYKQLYKYMEECIDFIMSLAKSSN